MSPREGSREKGLGSHLLPLKCTVAMLKWALCIVLFYWTFCPSSKWWPHIICLPDNPPHPFPPAFSITDLNHKSSWRTVPSCRKCSVPLRNEVIHGEPPGTGPAIGKPLSTCYFHWSHYHDLASAKHTNQPPSTALPLSQHNKCSSC